MKKALAITRKGTRIGSDQTPRSAPKGEVAQSFFVLKEQVQIARL
jgi:hypothetical protein